MCNACVQCAARIAYYILKFTSLYVLVLALVLLLLMRILHMHTDHAVLLVRSGLAMHARICIQCGIKKAHTSGCAKKKNNTHNSRTVSPHYVKFRSRSRSA